MKLKYVLFTSSLLVSSVFSQNLLTNGNFETGATGSGGLGNVSGWTTFFAPSDQHTGVIQNGQFHGSLGMGTDYHAVMGDTASGVTSDVALAQNISFIEGNYHRFSLDYLAVNTSGTGNGTLSVRFLNTVLNPASQVILVSGDSGTLSSEFQYTAPSGVRQVSIHWSPNSASATRDLVLIDDVVLQVVPEPSAAFLGAFGALALLRRRR